MGNNDFMRNWFLGDMARSARKASGRDDSASVGEVLALIVVLALVVLVLVWGMAAGWDAVRAGVLEGLQWVGRAVDGALS